MKCTYYFWRFTDQRINKYSDNTSSKTVDKYRQDHYGLATNLINLPDLVIGVSPDTGSLWIFVKETP